MNTTKKQLHDAADRLNSAFPGLDLIIISCHSGHAIWGKNNSGTPYFSGTASQCAGWLAGLQHGLHYSQKTR